jgi:hypothetical protein
MPIKVNPNELVRVKVDPSELVPAGGAPEKDLNALERTALSYGTGAWEGIRKAANWSFGMPSAPDFIKDPAVKEGQAKLDKITEGHPYSGGLPAFVGEMVGPTVATLPLGAPTVVGKGVGNALTRLALRAGSGAAQGTLASGMAGGDEAAGAGVGAGFGVGGPVVGGWLKKGGERASESAVKLLSSGGDVIDELADRFATKGGTVEQGLRRAGDALRSIKRGGERLVGPGQEAGNRALILEAEGKDAGGVINQVMREADKRGLKGSPREVLRQLEEARDSVLGTGPGSRLTDEQLAAKAKIDEHIQRFMGEFGTKAKPGAINPGAVPEESIPLVMHPEKAVRDPKGVPVIAESKVGASAPDTVRVFDPSENPMRRVARNEKGHATKGWVANDQPGLQTSREVDIPTEDWNPWRSFVAKQRARTVEGRPQPMSRNQYIPREVTRDAEIGVGTPFQNVDFADLPLSEFEEGAKRAYQQAAFLRKGSGAYRTGETAKADPFNQWLRRASGTLREHTESQLPPDLLEQFVPAKARSGLAQTMEPSAKGVAKARFSDEPGVGGSIEGTLYRALVRNPAQAGRPYYIAANEGLEKLGNALPEGTQEALMNAVIHMLKERR